jgi:hypothetical protein
VLDPRIIRLRVDGILGLTFFERFDEVRWKPRRRQITLIEP